MYFLKAAALAGDPVNLPGVPSRELTFLDTLLWVALPYVSIVVIIVGLVWRFKTDQYGWTSKSSNWNESAILRWSSPMFHFGILGVALGHVGGLFVPREVTEYLGITEHMYHTGAVVGGGIAGLVTIIGLLGLIYRRVVVKSVRLATSPMDIVTYVLMCVPIFLGAYATLVHQVLGGEHGYDYRSTISVWFRSILLLQPAPEYMIDVPLSFQLHVVAGMLLFCLWPFTRLVHVVSAPVGYLTRPHVVYRSRDESKAVHRPRGW